MGAAAACARFFKPGLRIIDQRQIGVAAGGVEGDQVFDEIERGHHQPSRLAGLPMMLRNSRRVSELSPEVAQHGRGDHGDAGLVHAARGHALMCGLDHDRHALGLQHFLDGVGDLGVHLLLHLQPPGIGFHHPRQLGDSHHALGGQIADMGAADDRAPDDARNGSRSGCP